MKKKEKQAIEDILQDFDFERVYAAMEALEWTWFDSKGKTSSIKALKKTAKEVLENAVNEKTTISTGGFHAEYDKNKGSSFLTLSFYVDSIQAEI